MDKSQPTQLSSRTAMEPAIVADEHFSAAHQLIVFANATDDSRLNPEASLGILFLLEYGDAAMTRCMELSAAAGVVDTPAYSTPMRACICIARRAATDEEMDTGGLGPDELTFMEEQLGRVLAISSSLRLDANPNRSSAEETALAA